MSAGPRVVPSNRPIHSEEVAASSLGLTIDSGPAPMRAGASMNHSERAITEVEAADRLGLSVKTLQAWRYRRTGPRFVRFGRAVRYMPSEVDDFIRASMVDTCGEEQVRA
jgi:predicted DNA-binding transcriptional regulator AlpA